MVATGAARDVDLIADGDCTVGPGQRERQVRVPGPAISGDVIGLDPPERMIGSSDAADDIENRIAVPGNCRSCHRGAGPARHIASGNPASRCGGEIWCVYTVGDRCGSSGHAINGLTAQTGDQKSRRQESGTSVLVSPCSILANQELLTTADHRPEVLQRGT